MYFKKCPFCNNSVKPRFNEKLRVNEIECLVCKSKGIKIKVSHKDIKSLQELWNTRVVTDDIYDNSNKSNYGYLIMNDGTVLDCDDSHPEELLKYLGIETDYKEFEYEKVCRELGILRISDHCKCIMIDLPYSITKEQIDKCIEVLIKYKEYSNFNIYKDNRNYVYEFDNLSDCILELDKVK